MKNAYAVKLTEQRRRESAERSIFTLQMASDAAILAANQVFGAGPKRAKQFHETMQQIFFEIVKMTTEDTTDIEYTKQRLDEALHRVLGENFQPWDKRYS